MLISDTYSLMDFDTRSDTPPAVTAQVYHALSQLSCEERLGRMLRLCEFGRQLMLEGIREQYPQISATELREHFAARLLGQELARKFLAANLVKK